MTIETCDSCGDVDADTHLDCDNCHRHLCEPCFGDITLTVCTDCAKEGTAIAAKKSETTTTKPKIITLCGSSKFCDIMAVCAWLLERDEGSITMGLHLLPLWYPTKVESHIAEAENVATNMDNLHLCKIDLSDEIFVVNYDDYIGDSTRREVEYALAKHKPVRWFTHDPIGITVKDMLRKAIEQSKGGT